MLASAAEIPVRARPLVLALAALTLADCKQSPSQRRLAGRMLQLAGIRRDAGASSPPPRALEHPPAPRAPTAFRLDAHHTGRSGWRLPRRPRIVARVTTQGRISAQAISVGDDVAVGSHDGFFYVASRSGAVRWRFNAADRIYTTPALMGDSGLVFGSDADRFVALNRRGRLQVALATDDDADTSPALAGDGTVRFAAGRTLYAADGDLTVRWRLAVGGKIFSSPAVGDDNTTYFGSQDNHIYAVSAEGRVAWRVQTGDDVDGTPSIGDDGTVYVGSDDGNVYAIARDGSLRWQHAVGGFVRAGVALGLDGTVLAPTYGPRAKLVALDRTTGREVWSYAIAGPPTREYGIASSPLVDADGRIAFGAPDDALHMVDRDGAHAQRLALPADVDGSPVLLDDRLLAVGCDDGVLYLVGE